MRRIGEFGSRIVPTIDFKKNNFTLSDPSPEIPYLKGAKVRPNILAFIYFYRKYLALLKNLFL
jgi:hypothetical protein